MAVTSKKVSEEDEIKAEDHNTLVDDVTTLDGKKPAWDEVTDKPTTFPAAAPKWADVTGKPSTFAPATHKHAIADVTDLEKQLKAITDRLDALEKPAE